MRGGLLLEGVGDVSGDSLQLSLHGDHQLEAGLAPPDVPPDLSEQLDAGPGIVLGKQGQLSALPVSVERFALGAEDDEAGEEEEDERGHGSGEDERRTDDLGPSGENIYS